MGPLIAGFYIPQISLESTKPKHSTSKPYSTPVSTSSLHTASTTIPLPLSTPWYFITDHQLLCELPNDHTLSSPLKNYLLNSNLYLKHPMTYLYHEIMTTTFLYYQIPNLWTPNLIYTPTSNLITDMLNEGAIQPSKSPYSSPLLPNSKPVNTRPYLYPHIKPHHWHAQRRRHTTKRKPLFITVLTNSKNKYGTWWFCIGYHGLNAIIIRDRFVMPTIDSFLNELHGATIFYKIDIRADYHQVQVSLKRH